MKRIFRSILNVTKDSKPTVAKEDLKNNYRAFVVSRVKPEEASEIKIYHWIEAHWRDFDEVPSVDLLFERARSEGEESVIAKITEILAERPFVDSDYRSVLKEKFEEQNKANFRDAISEAWKIAESGVKKGRKTLKGIPAAISYFTSKAREFRSSSNVKTESNIREEEDGKEVIEAYKERKVNSYAAEGLWFNLDKMDGYIRGLKPGQLMILAGYVGQGKTLLAANLAYNGILQGLNGLFIAMEMSFEEMRDMFYVLHAGSAEWVDHPVYGSKYSNMLGKVSYDDVTYGELSELSEQYFGEVTKDFTTNKAYGELYVYQPEEAMTPSLLEMVAYDYDAKLKEKGKQLDFICIDYVGLMSPDKSDRYGDFNTDLNNTIKKLKNLAITFDNGRRVRVFTPFQTNRTGWREAEKNEGVYKLSALSNAHEAERSSDLVVSVFFTPEMAKSRIIKIACLKHRKGAVFPAFEANVNWETKHIRDFIQNTEGSGDHEEELITEIPLDA